MEFRQWLIKNSVIFGSIIVLLAILVLLLGADMSAQTDKIVKLRGELALRLKLLDSLATLKKDAEEAGKLEADLRAKLPSPDQLISFEGELGAIAKANRMDFGFSFESEIPATDKLPGINNFLISSAGSFNNFINFLKSVEASPHFISFNFFDLSAKDRNYQITIKGKVFSE